MSYISYNTCFIWLKLYRRQLTCTSLEGVSYKRRVSGLMSCPGCATFRWLGKISRRYIFHKQMAQRVVKSASKLKIGPSGDFIYHHKYHASCMPSGLRGAASGGPSRPLEEHIVSHITHHTAITQPYMIEPVTSDRTWGISQCTTYHTRYRAKRTTYGMTSWMVWRLAMGV